MHVITKRRLREFAERHADARRPLEVWYKIMERARFTDSHELRALFPSVSFLGGHRTVFNISGNKYRLVVDMRYDLGRVYIRHMLTHGEYDRLGRDGML
jgi:mRNA interferase HigB